MYWRDIYFLLSPFFWLHSSFSVSMRRQAEPSTGERNNKRELRELLWCRVGTNRTTKTACSFSDIFPLHRESLVNDIPSGDVKIAYLFSVYAVDGWSWFSNFLKQFSVIWKELDDFRNKYRTFSIWGIKIILKNCTVAHSFIGTKINSSCHFKLNDAILNMHKAKFPRRITEKIQ